ncbi:MAG: T9SS type A sorting domain-containing protein, partial [Bacteroidota bacterium]|nr:T9SS type A sorting domain-containing protein [Bacteroidota bacterium]
SISGTFSVSAPSLQLLSPIGGEKLLVGSSVAISWLSTLIDSIKIEYQTSSTGEWKTIVASTPANKCSFIWKVAKENNSNDCKIKISDINHSEIYSISQVSFEINNAYIKIIKPDGGEFLVRKYQTYISWISQDVSSVKIEYQLEPGDNSWVTIIGNVPSTANSGKYLWTVPDVVSNRCRVKISDINSTAFAVSDSAFTIGSTGINEILTDDTYYKIFPIPATNNIQIEYYSKDRKQVVLELLDYTGRNLYKQNIILERNAINSIDVKDISNGIYFLRIDDEKDVHTKKIIISR